MSNTDLIRAVLISQRAILFDLRKQIPLAKFDVEVICVAGRNKLFTTYEIRKHFSMTSPQQVYRCIRKLVRLSVVVMMEKGIGGKPTYYRVTEKGYRYLNDYFVAIEKTIYLS